MLSVLSKNAWSQVMWVNDKLTSYVADWCKRKEGLVIPKWIDHVGEAVQELGKVYSAMIGTKKPLKCKKKGKSRFLGNCPPTPP